jgi:hypothetical protein
MAKRKRIADTQPMRALRDQPKPRKRGCLTYIAYGFIGVIALATIGQAGRGTQSSTSPRQVAPASTSARASNTPVRLATSTRQSAAQPTQAQSFPTKTPPPVTTVQPVSLQSSSPQTVDIAFSSPRQWYTTGNANVRSCPSTTCAITRTFGAGDSVTLDASADGQAVNSGNTQWYRLQGGGYIYSGVVSSAAPVVQQAAPQTQPEQPAVAGQPTQPPAAVQRRPANCTEARAMGLTAEQAGQWPHLDRDGDGVACYED